MNKIFLMIMVLCAAYLAFLRAEPTLYEWVPHDDDRVISLYGRDGCPSCERVSGELDDAGIPYDFYDVDESEAANVEMWELVRAAHGRNFKFILPVVTVAGEVLITPAFSELSELYGRKTWALW